MWVIGAYKDARGVERVDPHSAFGFPLAGRYAGHALILSSPNVPLEFSFGVVPLRRFEMRGELSSDSASGPGSPCTRRRLRDGPALRPGAGLHRNLQSERRAGGERNVRVRGISGNGERETVGPAGRFGAPGQAGSASRRECRCPARRHGAPAFGSTCRRGPAHRCPQRDAGRFAYRRLTSVARDPRGRIAGVRLSLPTGTLLPARVRAYVIVDAFPVGEAVLR